MTRSMPERRVETVAGIVRGMGREAHCNVRGVRFSRPGLPPAPLMQCTIEDAPSDLPDGDYVVTFDGISSQVRKTENGWLAGN